MSWVSKRGRRGMVGAAIAASVVCGGVGVLAGSAQASEEHALKASLALPAPVAPGAAGELNYAVRNVGDTATEGVLLNVSLPRGVRSSLETDPHCQRTGHGPDGGILVSCALTDQWGQLAPGETKGGKRDFQVDADAPADTVLGVVGILAVPLEDGEPTEDWHDLGGQNTVWAPIRTADAS